MAWLRWILRSVKRFLSCVGQNLKPNVDVWTSPRCLCGLHLSRPAGANFAAPTSRFRVSVANRDDPSTEMFAAWAVCVHTWVSQHRDCEFVGEFRQGSEGPFLNVLTGALSWHTELW